MKTCKDCIYENLCVIKAFPDAFENTQWEKEPCDHFKSKSEWIGADNPPETYRDEYEELIPFLVCCNGTKYPFRALYDGTNWGDGIGRLDVTHWMPLPDPPTMKGGAE